MQLTHVEMSSMITELAKLQVIFPGLATAGWIRNTATMIWQVCISGPSDFGTPDTLAWWLVQRCQPVVPLSRAKIKQLIRMSGGSQKTMDLLVAIAEERSTPSRLRGGWGFLQVNSYVAKLWAERAR